ncbi:hypothetical protein [Pantoea sp. Lij88]|uniref:hypothetical protein n=1 Tax=Pantoea sp. Lij88 TaxID=3028622 RepID=UPI0024B9D3D0|nr:hypothetical protein [Pantoea sp. Lij88]
MEIYIRYSVLLHIKHGAGIISHIIYLIENDISLQTHLWPKRITTSPLIIAFHNGVLDDSKSPISSKGKVKDYFHEKDFIITVPFRPGDRSGYFNGTGTGKLR